MKPKSTLRHNPLTAMRLLPALIAVGFMVSISTVSCKEEKQETIHAKADPEKTPTMTTTDVSTMISDSGVVRYKITTPLWYMFEEAREPKWTFPKGVHLEKFDLKLKPEATVDCDSAIFFKDKQLWRLDGYVNIRNMANERFLTNQLFWNQREQKIYSDSFIHIERDGKVIEGYGFESNEQMTRYHVLRVAAIFPADKFRESVGRPDSTASGAPSVAPPPAPDAPFNPHNPHIIASGAADDSHVKRHDPDRSARLHERLKTKPLKESPDAKQSPIKPQPAKPAKPAKKPASPFSR